MANTHRLDRNRDRHHIANSPVKVTGAPIVLFKQKTGDHQRMLKRCGALKRPTPKPARQTFRLPGTLLFRYRMPHAWFHRWNSNSLHARS